MNKQLRINFPIEINYNIIADGTTVRRNSDNVLGIIQKFGHRFEYGAKAFNAYYVRWNDGKLGYPNESDFTII